MNKQSPFQSYLDRITQPNIFHQINSHQFPSNHTKYNPLLSQYIKYNPQQNFISQDHHQHSKQIITVLRDSQNIDYYLSNYHKTKQSKFFLNTVKQLEKKNNNLKQLGKNLNSIKQSKFFISSEEQQSQDLNRIKSVQKHYLKNQLEEKNNDNKINKKHLRRNSDSSFFNSKPIQNLKNKKQILQTKKVQKLIYQEKQKAYFDCANIYQNSLTPFQISQSSSQLYNEYFPINNFIIDKFKQFSSSMKDKRQKASKKGKNKNIVFSQQKKSTKQIVGVQFNIDRIIKNSVQNVKNSYQNKVLKKQTHQKQYIGGQNIQKQRQNAFFTKEKLQPNLKNKEYYQQAAGNKFNLKENYANEQLLLKKVQDQGSIPLIKQFITENSFINKNGCIINDQIQNFKQ